MTFPENPTKESSPGDTGLTQVTSQQIDRNACPVDCIMTHSEMHVLWIAFSPTPKPSLLLFFSQTRVNKYTMCARRWWRTPLILALRR